MTRVCYFVGLLFFALGIGFSIYISKPPVDIYSIQRNQLVISCWFCTDGDILAAVKRSCTSSYGWITLSRRGIMQKEVVVSCKDPWGQFPKLKGAE